MKIYKSLIFLSIFLILIITLGSISASEDFNNLTSSENENILSDSSKTIVVPFDPENPNEVLSPRIQPAIDNANPGDTIVIEGNPVHCHITVNKPLNIVAGTGTTISPCPHNTHEGLTDHGIFYITKEGSGSTIKGFTFINKHKSPTPFAILVDGASDVTIKDCTMNYEANEDKISGIIISNSNNIRLDNLIVNDTLNGINIINSTNVDISNCVIGNNVNQAILISGSSRNINIRSNSILDNGNYGIKLLAADNIVINNNLIKNNGLKNEDSGSGIYVNTNITKLVVKGNVFLSNGLHAIMYDYRARNLNKEYGAELLTDIDNNYFEGHKSMILHHRIYVERSYGDLKYDAENDIYGNVGEGNYVDSKSYVYMKNAFIWMDVPCGFTYYTPEIPWTLDGNNGEFDFSLKLNLKEIKNGVYQVSIVDCKGNVASDFNSIYIPVFLNDYSTVIPQEGNIYRDVLIKNGVGIADFRSDYRLFNSTNNVITAAFPGLSEKVERNAFVRFKVNDTNLPFDPSTRLTASELTTYPLSDSYLSVRLTNSKDNTISNQIITFKFNGKTHSAVTDANGIAMLKVSLSSKRTYQVTIEYMGNDDYKSSTSTTKIIVKTGLKKSKIKASNIKVKKNKKKKLKVKLINSAGKALKKQRISVKLNGKVHAIKTNGKGIAKLSFKLIKVKKYKCIINFLGNADYKAASKKITISVTKK